ncbi:phosphotriesterase family protein [Candidatus Allofournierella excrementavium]|uniref:phosphotriesterase family protein n=1 Tax=Candidatus Allofournierella excrementavium TaxID=2838591 RepID=UPI00374F222F
MKKARTVTGDIPAQEMGFTYPHEHLHAVPPPQQKDRDLEVSDYEKSVGELLNFKSVGGCTLVEASTLDYGRDLNALQRMSLETGVHVIGTTGFNKHIYYPDWVAEKTTEQIADMLARDVEEGGDGGTAKAGFIKIGTYYNMIHPLEEKTAVAAVIAQKRTGAPIWGHTEAGTMGMEVLDILQREGADFSHVCLGHLDRNADEYYLLKLADRGIYIQFDGPGKVKYYPDSVRVALIKSIIAHGYIDQLLISGDMGRASYLEAYGGGPGFRFIATKFIARLLDEGVSEADIHKIFYDNPQRWLAVF